MLNTPGGVIAGGVKVGLHIIHEHVAQLKSRIQRDDPLLAVDQLGVAQLVRITRVVVVIKGLRGVADPHVAQITLIVVNEQSSGGVIVRRSTCASRNRTAHSIVVFGREDGRAVGGS